MGSIPKIPKWFVPLAIVLYPIEWVRDGIREKREPVLALLTLIAVFLLWGVVALFLAGCESERKPHRGPDAGCDTSIPRDRVEECRIDAGCGPSIPLDMAEECRRDAGPGDAQ